MALVFFDPPIRRGRWSVQGLILLYPGVGWNNLPITSWRPTVIAGTLAYTVSPGHSPGSPRDVRLFCPKLQYVIILIIQKCKAFSVTVNMFVHAAVTLHEC